MVQPISCEEMDEINMYNNLIIFQCYKSLMHNLLFPLNRFALFRSHQGCQLS
jgi:hypothetical protein